jgi:type III restriction enzyme
MTSIVLKPFQEDAVARLKKTFLSLWQNPDLGKNIVFQSPTGSGKTIMMAEFLHDLTADPRFIHADVAYIWITNSDDLAMQSKGKLWNYYGGAGNITLRTVADVQEGQIPKNGVFFVNWQKLVQSRINKRPLILRTEGESNTTFDEYLASTHDVNRDVVLIVDEEHIASDTVLANDLVQNVIKPRIILGVSATPNERGCAIVKVKREDVISAGLIKEKIVFQTAEDLHAATETDQDKILLEMAFNKRNELIEKYKELGIAHKINPLVLIQLPNDDKADSETNGVPKAEIVKTFLKAKGVAEHEIAVWLSAVKENLATITRNDDGVSFLLFKQAAATGWDCPRASILVMFREIKKPTFAIQTVGRILRMPFGEHFSIAELNRGYLFTNYERAKVLESYHKVNAAGQNRPAVFISLRKKTSTPIKLESTVFNRADYNDLGSSFEKTFQKTADKYFQITEDDILQKGIGKLFEKGLDTDASIKNSFIVGAEIDDYDNFVSELKTKGEDEAFEMSYHDVVRLYDLLCFQIIARQTTESNKYAPERSWSDLKTAINVWFAGFYSNKNQYYRVIVKDLLKHQHGNSVLTKVIDEALTKYRPLRDAEVGARAKNKKQAISIEVPPAELFFTDLFEAADENDVQKCAMEPFYVEKEHVGKQNESNFITHLENNPSVIWWHKNGDYGHEFFAVLYFDTVQHKERLFYPDWFVKTADKIWIIDTKSGWTADIAADKNAGLSQWLVNNPEYDGGVAVFRSSIWKIVRKKEGQDVEEALRF